jgi:hypothetical protein
VHRRAAERFLADLLAERALDQRRPRDHHLRGVARHHREVRGDQPRRGESRDCAECGRCDRHRGHRVGDRREAVSRHGRAFAAGLGPLARSAGDAPARAL